uniref:Dehydrogenase/reductase SDR family member 11 n=1 Tax=Tenebrio molitor TaxID=7067 RepID=A0A8J6LBG1_TENMO|nr:hypothetical protein GEV33_015215 [Tenebrio molitor]
MYETFQNGLSDPDFRYPVGQVGERRGKYIKVEQTPFLRFSTSSGERLRPIRSATGAGEPVEEDRSGWETVLEEFQPYVAADKGFLHEGHRPYASADHFATLLGRRHPQGSHQRTRPHTGLPLAEEPESRSNSYLARKGRGEEGPRGLSEDTDGVIDQWRKKDSEDLPPAHSSKDSFWISSPRPGAVRGKLNSLVCRRSKLSTKNKITIYRTIVRPAMMYGVAIWGNVANTQLQKLQVVQNKFLRAFFNAPWLVRNAQLHWEANLPTIREYRQDVAGKFFENAANHPNPLVRESVNYDENNRRQLHFLVNYFTLHFHKFLCSIQVLDENPVRIQCKTDQICFLITPVNTKMERWEGKVAVVTGVSSGIGAAIAKALVEKGLKVIGLARRIDRVEELACSLADQPGELFPISCDVTKEDNILEAFKWVVENVGPVHILINNAGLTKLTNLTDGSTEMWREVFDVNVLALCICTREAVKVMKEHDIDGHIVHLNSIAGHVVHNVPSFNVYPASKFAVTALTESLRLELVQQKSRIKVTSISPGVVRTEFLEGMSGDDKDVIRQLPYLRPEAVADAIVYVLSTDPAVQITELTIRPVGEPI